MENESPTILLVEDLPNLREVMASELADHGYRVLTAADGREALELLAREEHVDLILLDRHMPRMDGDDFLGHKGGDARFVHIPVIMCTGVAPPDPVPAGVREVLRKPVPFGRLRRAIQAALATC